MKRSALLLVLILACACLTLASSDTEPKATEDKLCNPLVGTWKIVSAKHGGVANDLPTRYTILKHVTPTHFMWVWIEPSMGEVVMASGGTYSLTADTYTENPSYGLGRVFRNNRGSRNPLNWRVEGNKWYHSGQLANGTKIEEVWERVENKPPADNAEE